MLLAVTSVLVLALQPLYVAADPLARDPWLLRALTAAACLAVLATIVPAAHAVPALRRACCLRRGHGMLLALVAINAFAWQYALTLLVFVAGLAGGHRRAPAPPGTASAAPRARAGHPAGPGAARRPRPYIGARRDPRAALVHRLRHAHAREERLVGESSALRPRGLGASDGLWDWNVVRGVVFYSTRWKATLGYAPNEIGHSLDDWLDACIPRIAAPWKRHSMRCTRAAPTSRWSTACAMRTARGATCSAGCRLRDRNGRVLRVTGSQVDITSRKRAEQQLLHDALHDTLTGLPNRALFLDRLERFLHHAQRRPSFRFAVLFIDLDRFKVVNDSLGHPAGDSLLIDVARRLELLLRPEDTLARLGGDEFAVLVDDVRDGEAAVRIADRIQQALNEPFRTRGQRLYVSASIGIALGGAGSTTDALCCATRIPQCTAPSGSAPATHSSTRRCTRKRSSSSSSRTTFAMRSSGTSS